ncbi:polysaccharide deacetylase family protein [Streptomyces sp. NPDC004609]|uniref:polysaccharide deacetylase family protein n=1 Tax=Streptomyces sp. NPDC004609 TaxID=3364704 RepID=UPI00367DE581
MKKDQTPPDRRSVLRIAAGLGAFATAGLLVTDVTPGGEAAPPRSGGGAAGSAGGVRPVSGPQIAGTPPLKSSSYRLLPMTGHQPAKARRALPPVRRHPFLRLPETGRTMVLTFDDGPDPRYTPDILSVLRRYGVPAMFFVCGGMAAASRGLLREMADDGHVIGNHSWSHPLIPKLPPSGIRSELGRTSEMIEKVLGEAPLWYRAPFGAWNRLSFEIGAELGMEPLAWTIDTLDWTEPGTGTIVRRVVEGAGPGVVVLSHDAGGNRSQSVAALRSYLPKLLDAGYRITVPSR